MNLKPFMKYKDWYVDSNKHIKSLFAGYSDDFIGILACTSPRKSVKANWRLAIQVFDAQFTGKPLGSIKGLMRLHKILLNRFFDTGEVKGMKIKAFAENLKGNLSVPTIDTWMKVLYKVKSLTPKQHKIITKKLQLGAKRHNLKVAEYQAVLWAYIRAKNGYKQHGGFDTI